MDRRTVLEKLRSHQSELEHAGISHLRLFGSVARDEASVSSDIDLMADFDGSRRVTLVMIGSLQSRLTSILGGKVDLSSAAWLREPVKTKAEHEAIVAF